MMMTLDVFRPYKMLITCFLEQSTLLEQYEFQKEMLIQSPIPQVLLVYTDLLLIVLRLHIV